MLQNIRVSLGAFVPLLVFIAPSSGLGQDDAKLQFEVASVRPSAPPGRGGYCRGGPGTDDPGFVVCQNWHLISLVTTAYDVDYFRVSAPEWMHDLRYDVRARVPEGTTKKQLSAMWQNLLAERFKLVVHRETKESQIYDLLVAKSGPKLKAAAATPAKGSSRNYAQLKLDGDGYPAFGPGHPGMAWSSDFAGMYFPQRSVEWLAAYVSAQLASPVNDKTGLSGKFDISLRWVSDRLAETGGGPTLIQALRDQLGLHLESKKGPVEFLIVDHAERSPIDN